MKYAKLIDGNIHFAPSDISIDGMTVANPTAEQLAQLGYLPVDKQPVPETDDTHYAVSRWEQTADVIRQVWTVKEVEPPPPTPEERIAALSAQVDDLTLLMADIVGGAM